MADNQTRALSDTLDNPTVAGVGAYLLGWDGTQWVRVDVDTNGVLKVVGGTAASADQVQGNVAHDAVDSGNPVKIGGVASDAAPTAVAVGDRANGWFGLNGQQIVASNNEVATLLTSAARTATTNTPDQTNYNGKGVMIALDVTVEGPATLALKVQGKHSVGGTYFDIVDFGVIYTAATDAPGAKAGVMYPGVLAADHVGVGAGVNGTIAKSGVLPRTWRVVVTHADATTCTYSLASTMIP